MPTNLTIVVPVGLMAGDVSETRNYSIITIENAASLFNLILQISGKLTQPGYTIETILRDDGNLYPAYNLIAEGLGRLTKQNFDELPNSSEILLVPLGQDRAAGAAAGAVAAKGTSLRPGHRQWEWSQW